MVVFADVYLHNLIKVDSEFRIVKKLIIKRAKNKYLQAWTLSFTENRLSVSVAFVPLHTRVGLRFDIRRLNPDALLTASNENTLVYR